MSPNGHQIISMFHVSEASFEKANQMQARRKPNADIGHFLRKKTPASASENKVCELI